MTTPHAQRHPATAVLCIALLLTVSLVMTTGCADEQAQPADEQQATMDPIARGKASYERYCQSCHGPDGKGTGELQTDLATPPADLTQLTTRHGGSFSVDSIYQTIDGRKIVEGHGPREMPVWGNIWGEESGQPVSDEVIERRINELIEYIRSIQE